MERKVFTPQFKTEAEGDRLIVSCFISTERPDRGNDVVRANGMKINGIPTVLFGHGTSPGIGHEPVGKFLEIGKGEFGGYPGIKTKIELYPDETGKRLFGKIKGGYLHSMSIGFLVLESEPRSNGGRDIKVWELLEASFVAVPMQPDAQMIESQRFEGFQCKFLNSSKDEKRYVLAGKVCTREELPNWLNQFIGRVIKETIRQELDKAMGRVE